MRTNAATVDAISGKYHFGISIEPWLKALWKSPSVVPVDLLALLLWRCGGCLLRSFEPFTVVPETKPNLIFI